MRILITGGSGFLGRALTKRLQDDHTVCIYSRSESAQAALPEHVNVRKFIGDVRDHSRLKRAMQGCDVVIHAAALKRIEVGRYNPDEMTKTNINGTMNVIDAAHDVGCTRVVYVSTDKAWQPVSPYGMSKALAESLMLSANGMLKPRYVVVRYGNVMGSTGSVIPVWRAATGRVRVTDPEVTRFWMSVDEACDLVLKACYTEHELLLPPDLPAFRLGDLAEAMERTYDVVGLPPWEKRHEGLNDGYTSDKARRLTVDEIRERLAHA